ncbi:GNAT family N-acetyltransferase [Mangrovivirga sp. M17]|uniref:GNAT family N-acetyltransferase n=1 Tax=Mangrovivirga halotolerans TaxID=2993936 RepID=A0ABT3RV94_9BACT|nr:GNAT family N-acetyltransferase [Mangrovivirga halotolerans]MCX2745560.1 GNAT family N-acetyltransferase [Mangrovivirga halotolerans]
MKIRPADINDLKPLSILFDSYRVFYKKTSNLADAEHFLKERLNNKDSKIYVAEALSNNLVGFVQLYPLFSSTNMKRLWLLNDLFVSPKYRGQGISISLIDRAKQLAEDTESAGIMLETEKSNLIGNKLYPKADFKLDTEHNYYSWEP